MSEEDGLFEKDKLFEQDDLFEQTLVAPPLAVDKVFSDWRVQSKVHWVPPLVPRTYWDKDGGSDCWIAESLETALFLLIVGS